MFLVCEGVHKFSLSGDFYAPYIYGGTLLGSLPAVTTGAAPVTTNQVTTGVDITSEQVTTGVDITTGQVTTGAEASTTGAAQITTGVDISSGDSTTGSEEPSVTTEGKITTGNDRDFTTGVEVRY